MKDTQAVDVLAPPEVLWAVVVDVQRWPRLTESIRSVRPLTEGALAVGSEFEVRQPGLPAAVWTVTALEPGRSFTWVSAGRGVSTVATHRVSLTPGGSTLTLTLDQSGPLAGVVGLLLGRKVRRFVALEAQGLGDAAESPSPG